MGVTEARLQERMLLNRRLNTLRRLRAAAFPGTETWFDADIEYLEGKLRNREGQA